MKNESLNAKVLRFFNTIRYLKPQQIAYRIFYKFRKLTIQPQKSSGLADWQQSWHSSSYYNSPLISKWHFDFLGEKARLVGDDWNDKSKSKLWLYNLHYFDLLNANDSEEQFDIHQQLVEKWITDNPPMIGNGWEPYTLSLRLVNWVKWLSYHQVKDPLILDSLVTQSVALSKQLEFHILANHLFANAKALVFVGAFIKGDEGKFFLTKGLSILDKEVAEQFLADGGHFERSPMYHAILLWDMCDLLNLAQIAGIEKLETHISGWIKVIRKGLYFHSKMSHLDGEVSFFNDSTQGISPSLKILLEYTENLGIDHQFDTLYPSTTWLQDCGYVVVDIAPESKAILDLALVGPDYQPGHAHADTLSFELSLFGKRVFVNSGISQYNVGTERDWQRSTAAHNTVEINGENSSDVWGGFRVGRRAYPFDISINNAVDVGVDISGGHDGYQQLKGQPIHQRNWSFKDNEMVVTDAIQGSFDSAKAYFYLHPDIKITQKNMNQYVLSVLDRTVHLEFIGVLLCEIKETCWYPSFGQSIPNLCFVGHFQKNKIITKVNW